MRWTFDLDANAVFIFLGEPPVAGQVEMPDGVVVDVDANGSVVAIEVLSPGAGWDIDTIVTRFALDDETRRSLLWLRDSPLMNARARRAGTSPAIEARPSGSSANLPVRVTVDA
jgi:uncharacterized protein YuzE